MTEKVKNSSNQQLIIMGGIVALVVVAIGAFVALQTLNQPATLDYTKIHQERTEDGAFILGDPEAPVTIVAFEDFLCPHCQAYQPEVHQILEQYVATGKARFEFRMLPISQLSPVPFGLAECSEELKPGSFWVAHDTLFRIASTSYFDQGSPRQFAEEMEIPYSELLDCLETSDQYQIDATFSSDFTEITGTPAVAWRLNGGGLRFDVISRRPTPAQVGALISMAETQLQ